MQFVPQIVSCFKICSTRLLALQCSRKLTNHTTEYSKVHRQRPSSTSTKSDGKQHFFSGKEMDKNTTQNAPNTKFQVKKINFGEGPSSSPIPSPHPSDPTLALHQAFWIRPCVPQNSSQIYATKSSVWVLSDLLRSLVCRWTYPYWGGSRQSSTLGRNWRVWSLVCATFIGFSLSLIALFRSAINFSCIEMSLHTWDRKHTCAPAVYLRQHETAR